MSKKPYLYAKNAENDEKGATYEDNVTNGLEWWKQGLDHQLQSRSPIYHS